MTMSITEARDRLTSLPDELEARHEALTITRRGTPVLAVLPYEFYEALIETLELMSDPEAMNVLYAGIADAANGRVEDAEAVFEDLGW